MPPVSHAALQNAGTRGPRALSLPPWLFVALATGMLTTAFALSPTVLGPSLGAACAVWAAYRWPYVFVVLTIWTTVVPTLYVFQIESFGFAPYILFEVAAVIGLALRWATGRTRLVVPPGFMWLVVHVLLTSVSAFLAADAVATASMLARLWLNWLMVLLVLAVITDRARLVSLLTALSLQAFVVVGISVASSLGNLNLPSFPSILFPHFQKNDYATYLSFVVALAVVAIAAKGPRFFGRFAGSVLLLLVCVSWPLTYSRSGILSLLAMLLALTLLYRTKRLLGVLVVVVFVAAVGWTVLPAEVKIVSVRAVQSLVNPDNGERDSFADTYEDRLILNWAALESIVHQPLLGIGLGEWMSRSPVQVAIWDLKKEGVVTVGANIHNRYLLIAAESGVAALVSYLGFVTILLIAALRLRRRADPWMRLLLSSMCACTIGFLVSNLFIPGTLWEWNLLAVLAAAVQIAERDTATSPVVSRWQPRTATARR